MTQYTWKKYWITFQGLKSTLFSEYVWTDHNRQNRIECINWFKPMIDYEIQPIPHYYLMNARGFGPFPVRPFPAVRPRRFRPQYKFFSIFLINMYKI